MIKRLLRDENGASLVMAVAFLSLALPTTVGALQLAGTLSTASLKDTDDLLSQYAAIGGQQYGEYRLVYEDTFAEGLPLNTASTQTVTINGKTVSVTVKKTAEPPAAPVLMPEAGRELRVTKSVQPATTTVSMATTTFTYNITVFNTSSSTVVLDRIYDQLPAGLSYVTGSTTDLTAGEYCIFESGTLSITSDTSVSCNIASNADINLKQGATIVGNVLSLGGDVDLTQSSLIVGNIRAQEDVSLKQTGEVQGDIVAGGDVDLQQDAEGVSGDIIAGGDVTLTQDAVVTGNVIAGGNVTLSQTAKVEGNVTAGGTITVLHSAQIVGTQESSATITSIPALELVLANPTGGGNVQIITTNPPSLSGDVTSGYLLTWAPLFYSIPSADKVTLSFQATGTFAQGAYCNEAWADPGGRTKNTTGLTAKIVVGSPSSTVCPGAAATIAKTVTPTILEVPTTATFTYIVTLNNTGTTTLTLTELKDLLPAGFTYTVASGSGITSAEPTIATVNGRPELTWTMSTSTPPTIAAGATATQTFQAAATPSAGNHYNDVWATFTELSYVLYTWPTAVVKAMSVMETCSSDGGVAVSTEVWLGADSELSTGFEITNGSCP